MTEGWLWRVEQEERDLNLKIDRLAEFIRSDDYKKRPPAQQELLREQHMHMVDYRLVLRKRIALAYDEGEGSQTA